MTRTTHDTHQQPWLDAHEVARFKCLLLELLERTPRPLRAARPPPKRGCPIIIAWLAHGSPEEGRRGLRLRKRGTARPLNSNAGRDLARRG